MRAIVGIYYTTDPAGAKRLAAALRLGGPESRIRAAEAFRPSDRERFSLVILQGAVDDAHLGRVAQAYEDAGTPTVRATGKDYSAALHETLQMTGYGPEESVDAPVPMPKGQEPEAPETKVKARKEK